MKRKLFWFVLAAFVVIGILPGTQSKVYAIPTFQAYIQDASRDDFGDLEDDWVTFDSTFTLAAVAAYGPKTTSIHAYLLVSVPDLTQATISISPLGGVETPTLETIAPGSLVPADRDVLTDVTGIDGFATTDFFPDNFNAHYPLQDDVSDFLIFDLGEFANNPGGLYDYNADTDDGGISFDEKATGEEKRYEVSIGGIGWAHFDVFGKVITNQNKKVGYVEDWEISPSSHDASVVPEPATMLLLGVGLIGLVGIGRKRLFKTS